MPYDSRAVANIVLDIADAHGLSLTHMAVHKVSYYAHGWHLAEFRDPLIQQEFEAWRDGPVQRLVYDSLKEAGSRPVRIRATKLDLVTRQVSVVHESFSNVTTRLITNVVRAYGHLHAFELSEMTHESGGPWDQIYNAPGGKVTLGMRIPHSLIGGHFLSRARSAPTA